MGVDAVVRFTPTDQRELSPKDLRQLSWSLGRAFGADRFWFSSGDQASLAVSAVDEPPTRTYPGKYKVSLWGRYYGPGYERGNLPFLLALFRFLRHRRFTVYYGGDNGYALDKVTPKFMQALERHWFTTNDTWLAKFSSLDGSTPVCPRCGYCTAQTTWSGLPELQRFTCVGCGNRFDVGGRFISEGDR